MEETKLQKKNYYLYALILIIIFSFSINLYYFFLTKDQPLWWDEAEYMSTAKSWAFDIPYQINQQRPPLFPLLGAITLKLGLSDLVFKFLFILIPTVLNVFVIYLLGKEMFNKKVGLGSSFIMAVFWSLIFWTARFHPDSLTLLLQLLTIYYFWKAFVKIEEKKAVLYSLLMGVSAGLAFLIKIQALLVFPIFGIFLLCTGRWKILKKREFWYAAVAFFITLLPYLIWNFFSYGTPLAFTKGYVQPITGERPSPAWNMLYFVQVFTEWPYLVLFFVGLAIIILNLVLGIDLLIKRKNDELQADFFALVTIVVVLAFFIFYMRIKTAEERWLYLMAPSLFILAAKGTSFLYEKIKKYNKIVAIIIILCVMFFGAYIQLKHADQIINEKKETYLQVKLAALWMKDNTVPGDKLFSISFPQTQYYSDRQTLSYWPPHSGYNTVEEFADWIKRIKPKFLTISIFENHPEWIVPYVQNNTEKFIPVQAYFLDQEQKQLALVVYEVKL